MDQYYEEKKRKGYILTLHDFDPQLPYLAMVPGIHCPAQVEPGDGKQRWSRLSGRYRDSAEQKEYYRTGHTDNRLPERG